MSMRSWAKSSFRGWERRALLKQAQDRQQPRSLREADLRRFGVGGYLRYVRSWGDP